MLISLHVFCAFLSLGLLLVRGILQFLGKDWRAIKPLRILPHIADSLLIVSGLAVFWVFGYSLEGWIIAKILCLLLYVFFSAKYFSRKAQKANTLYLLLALVSFLGAICIAYHPNWISA